MRYLLILGATLSFLQANITNIDSFQAHFTQTIIDDKKKELHYKGDVLAKKPQNALWRYTTPVNKQVFINSRVVTIVEPELEQAIVKDIESNFNFFQLLKDAKEIDANHYVTFYKETKFTIVTNKNGIVESINYKDEFENNVIIKFQNQIINKQIATENFIPNLPLDYDIIRD